MVKRKIFLIIISIAIIAVAFSLLNKEEETVEIPINIEVRQQFEGINYTKTKYVLNYKIADFNGDAVNDVAIFVGEKESVESKNVKNADIVFYDGALQKYINADLKKFDGESPRLEIADLTGDSLSDIVLILNNTSGDKTIRIVTLINEELKEIFKDKNNKYINFTGNFLDGFKINVNNKRLNINKELDLKNNITLLKENKIFDDSGKYLDGDNSKIRTTGFIEVDFVQLTDFMGIKTKQRIVTKDNKVIIDEFDIIWKYEEGKWQIKEAIGVKMGNLLY